MKIGVVLALLPFLVLVCSTARGQDDDCLMCHGERDFIVEIDGRQVSLYVNGRAFAASAHAEMGCTSCHMDADISEGMHEPDLAEVDCGICHDVATERFNQTLHGIALREGRYLAPSCETCHGKHDTLLSSDRRAQTYVMNIPSLCGSCHKEGTPVSELRSVEEGHVLEDYSQSIHGDGLFKRGLIVTAVCTSCHTSHDILRHEDPASTINRNNIAGTCMKCHAQIEQVHLKVIRGELWEERPHEIPICIDCHQPHKVRRVFYEESYPDGMCMSCHGDPDLTRTIEGETFSLYVDQEEVAHSTHFESSCIKCHANISASQDPVCKDSGLVDCSMCHAGPVADYQTSQHGRYHAQGNPNAPYCTDCHGTHGMQRKEELSSPTFSRNIPDLCGRCHREGQKAAVAYQGEEHEIIEKYTMSIHGKGLMQSGLLVTATCIDCHTAHRELPADDPDSTVSGQNIALTCSQCHLGIYEEYKGSVHSPLANQTDQEQPTCSSCHLSHTIKRVDLDNFRQEILDQCGKCHLEVTETYFETFHGKVSKLGAAQTAKCFDCHGAHNIRPPSDPQSTLSRQNVVETCKQCHPNSNRMFVGYLTHATHHDQDKYPYLYYTFWFMTGLLVMVFAFSGAHTLLWLPRALRERKAHGAEAPRALEGRYYERFDAFSRFLHFLVIVSFLSLAITGMTIKFSDVWVFQILSRVMGGYQVSGFVHRVAAIITFIYFFLHVGYLIRKVRVRRRSIKSLLIGERTLLFQWDDVKEFFQTVKWFLGLGPRPRYGRWTYWEKFDYFAVFWGVAIIGSSGLMLWFPEFFTRIGFPGWLINVATIIHSDEALLATGFIFTIHFFNTHFQPSKFPMDPVIFTGRVLLDDLREERPREYAAIMRDRSIKKKLVAPPPPWLERGARIFGLSCLAIGIFTIVLIIYSMLFVYR